MSDFLSILNGRTKDLNPQKYAYQTQEGQYALDTVIGDTLDLNESQMSVWIPFASGVRRDGVGDLLEVAGIVTERHEKNPIALYDHAKAITLPIGLVEDPITHKYTVEINPQTQTARGCVYFYQGKGLEGVPGVEEYEHATFCEQLFDLIAKRYIRGGSIGYQIVQAQQLPPDYTKGIPQGLHLMKTLMLEMSIVVMPANQDTVRKALCLGQVCGKPLSPVLVKSLTPYAGPKKAQMGYEGKAAPGSHPVQQEPGPYRAGGRTGPIMRRTNTAPLVVPPFQTPRGVDNLILGRHEGQPREQYPKIRIRPGQDIHGEKFPMEPLPHADNRRTRQPEHSKDIRSLYRPHRQPVPAPAPVPEEGKDLTALRTRLRGERPSSGNPLSELRMRLRGKAKAIGPNLSIDKVRTLDERAQQQQDFGGHDDPIVFYREPASVGEHLIGQAFHEQPGSHLPAEEIARRPSGAYNEIPYSYPPHKTRRTQVPERVTTGNTDSQLGRHQIQPHVPEESVDNSDALRVVARPGRIRSQHEVTEQTTKPEPDERKRTKSQPSDKFSKRKAEQMLKDGTAHGHPLTERQRVMLKIAKHRGEKSQPSAGIPPRKACKIVEDDRAHGHELTEAQRGMFGAACGRRKKDLPHQGQKSNYPPYRKPVPKTQLDLGEFEPTPRDKWEAESGQQLKESSPRHHGVLSHEGEQRHDTTKDLPVPLGNVRTYHNIPPAKWKPGVGVMKSLRMKYRGKATPEVLLPHPEDQGYAEPQAGRHNRRYVGDDTRRRVQIPPAPEHTQARHFPLHDVRLKYRGKGWGSNKPVQKVDKVVLDKMRDILPHPQYSVNDLRLAGGGYVGESERFQDSEYGKRPNPKTEVSSQGTDQTRGVKRPPKGVTQQEQGILKPGQKGIRFRRPAGQFVHNMHTERYLTPVQQEMARKMSGKGFREERAELEKTPGLSSRADVLADRFHQQNRHRLPKRVWKLPSREEKPVKPIVTNDDPPLEDSTVSDKAITRGASIGDMPPSVRFPVTAKAMNDPQKITEKERAEDWTAQDTGEVAPRQELDTSWEQSEVDEPLGAQVLREIHRDHTKALMKYHTILGHLEHTGVKDFVQRHLGHVSSLLDHLEGLHSHFYKDLPPLGYEDSEGEDQEQYGDEDEYQEQGEEFQGDEAVPVDSEQEPLPTPNEALEGMQRQMEEEEGYEPGQMGQKARRRIGPLTSKETNRRMAEGAPGATGEYLDDLHRSVQRLRNDKDRHQIAKDTESQRASAPTSARPGITRSVKTDGKSLPQIRAELRGVKSGLPPIEDEPLYQGETKPAQALRQGDRVTSKYGTGVVQGVGSHIHVKYPNRRFVIAHGHHEVQPVPVAGAKSRPRPTTRGLKPVDESQRKRAHNEAGGLPPLREASDREIERHRLQIEQQARQQGGKAISDSNAPTREINPRPPEQGSDVRKPGYLRNERGIYGATPRASARNITSHSSPFHPHERAFLKDAHTFLKQLTTETAFGDEHRMKSFHFHKTLEPMGMVEDKAEYPPRPQRHAEAIPLTDEEIAALPEGTDIPEVQATPIYDEPPPKDSYGKPRMGQKAQYDPSKGDKPPYGEGAEPVVDELSEQSDQPAHEPEITLDVPEAKGLDYSQGRKHIAACSKFFKKLSTERAFGDPHRQEAYYHHKTLEPYANEVMEEQTKTQPIPEDPVDPIPRRSNKIPHGSRHDPESYQVPPTDWHHEGGRGGHHPLDTAQPTRHAVVPRRNAQGKSQQKSLEEAFTSQAKEIAALQKSLEAALARVEAL